jgi:hypothetical protein
MLFTLSDTTTLRAGRAAHRRSLPATDPRHPVRSRGDGRWEPAETRGPCRKVQRSDLDGQWHQRAGAGRSSSRLRQVGSALAPGSHWATGPASGFHCRLRPRIRWVITSGPYSSSWVRPKCEPCGDLYVADERRLPGQGDSLSGLRLGDRRRPQNLIEHPSRGWPRGRRDDDATDRKLENRGK